MFKKYFLLVDWDLILIKGWIFNFGGTDGKTWFLWVPNETKATYANAYHVSWRNESILTFVT